MGWIEVGAVAQPLNSDCHYGWEWPLAPWSITLGPFNPSWDAGLMLAGEPALSPVVWSQNAARLLPRTCRR